MSRLNPEAPPFIYSNTMSFARESFAHKTTTTMGEEHSTRNDMAFALETFTTTYEEDPASMARNTMGFGQETFGQETFTTTEEGDPNLIVINIHGCDVHGSFPFEMRTASQRSSANLNWHVHVARQNLAKVGNDIAALNKELELENIKQKMTRHPYIEDPLELLKEQAMVRTALEGAQENESFWKEMVDTLIFARGIAVHRETREKQEETAKKLKGPWRRLWKA